MYINSLNSFEDMLCLSLIGRGKKKQVDHHIIICSETHVRSPVAVTDTSWFQEGQADSAETSQVSTADSGRSLKYHLRCRD